MAVNDSDWSAGLADQRVTCSNVFERAGKLTGRLAAPAHNPDVPIYVCGDHLYDGHRGRDDARTDGERLPRGAAVRSLTGVRSFAAHAAVFVWLAGAGQESSAQTTFVPSAPTCTACSIRLDLVSTLGGAGDAVDITTSSVVVRRGDGYAVAPVGDRTQLAFYGRSGALERVAGRQGQGPGEFNNIRSLAVLPGQTVVVLDQRITLLPAGAAAPVVSRALPAGISAGRLIALADGRLVVNNYRPGRQPICLFGTDLTLIRCFGDAAAPTRDGPAGLERLIVPGDRGTIWAGTQQYRYAIERYDTGGHLIARIERDAAWFPASRPEDDPVGSIRQSRPLPRLSGLWVDRGGRIWTAVLVPDQHWHATAPAPRAGREGRPAPMVPVSEWGQYFDTIVEVIDPVAGRVVVSQRFPGVLAGFTSDGLMTELRETGDGLLQEVMLRPEIAHAGARR